MCPVSFFFNLWCVHVCTRGISCRPFRKKKKTIKRIQSIVQLYIRQQSVHMTRKSGQTVGNDQRGWPWKWAKFSFYIVKERGEKEEREREKEQQSSIFSKCTTPQGHFKYVPYILCSSVVLSNFFFFFLSLFLSLFFDASWTLLHHNQHLTRIVVMFVVHISSVSGINGERSLV